jgi:hypothetical protein
MIVLRACLAALVLSVVWAAPLRAQTPEEQARALFEQGLVASDARRWDDAAALFQRSRELVERPSTLFNLVVVLHRLGRYREGLLAGSAYLRIAGGETGERRAEVDRLLSEMQLAVGSLRLRVQPRTARVMLDGVRLDPAEPYTLALDPGKHVLSVRAEGHEDDTRELGVERGGKYTLDVTLLPEAARSLPPVAVVSDDQAALPGSDVSKPGSTPRQRRVRRVLWAAGTLIFAAGLATLIVTTRPEPSQPEPTGGSTGVTLPL